MLLNIEQGKNAITFCLIFSHPLKSLLFSSLSLSLSLRPSFVRTYSKLNGALQQLDYFLQMDWRVRTVTLSQTPSILVCHQNIAFYVHESQHTYAVQLYLMQHGA